MQRDRSGTTCSRRGIRAHPERRAEASLFGLDGPPYAGLDQSMWASQQVCNIICSLANYKDAEGRTGRRTDLHVALRQSTTLITKNFQAGPLELLAAARRQCT
jgi:hypothetical protein